MAIEQSLWGNLPLLVRANSKESVEMILQTLWRTRKVGLDSSDRDVIRDILHLHNDSDLDPLLVCLRMLIRRCVYENTNKDDIQKLFPAEVLPEIQRLLTLLLQKFHTEWREDISKDQLNGNTVLNSGGTDVNYKLAKDTLETILKSMHSTTDQPASTEMSQSIELADSIGAREFKYELGSKKHPTVYLKTFSGRGVDLHSAKFSSA